MTILVVANWNTFISTNKREKCGGSTGRRSNCLPKKLRRSFPKLGIPSITLWGSPSLLNSNNTNAVYEHQWCPKTLWITAFWQENLRILYYNTIYIFIENSSSYIYCSCVVRLPVFTLVAHIVCVCVCKFLCPNAHQYLLAESSKWLHDDAMSELRLTPLHFFALIGTENDLHVKKEVFRCSNLSLLLIFFNKI